MPVIREPRRRSDERRDQLVERIASELAVEANGAPIGEPLIVEKPIGTTGKYHAVVIWSEWESVPWEERAGIITDAYRRFDATHPDSPPRVTDAAIATGFTWDEADANAFFPYFIATPTPTGAISAERSQAAMLEEGGVSTPTGVKLRFLHQRDAFRAQERLEKKLPGVDWSVRYFGPSWRMNHEG